MKLEELCYHAFAVASSLGVLDMINHKVINTTPRAVPPNTTHLVEKFPIFPMKIAGSNVIIIVITTSTQPGRAFILSRILPINNKILKYNPQKSKITKVNITASMNNQFKLGTGFSSILKNEMKIINANISTKKIEDIRIVRLVLFRHKDIVLTQLRICISSIQD